MIKFLLILKKIRYLFLNLLSLKHYIKYNNLTLHLFLNSTCNAKCKFCVVRKMKQEEIPEKVLYDYAKPLYPKTNVLIPTFGEYTISKNGYEYLNWVANNYPNINFFTETNGINFNEKWQEFSMKNLVLTACSLNAINAKRYQETVWEGEGGEAAYTKIITNLKNYQNKLKEKGLETFCTRLSMVLTPDNYSDIEEFIRLSLELDSPYVTFFFDYTNFQIFTETPSEDLKKTLITLIEIEKMLIGKYFIFYKLFMPFNNKQLNEYEKQAESNKEKLIIKYSKIWELAKNRNCNEEYNKRKNLRKKQGKSFISQIQEVAITGTKNPEFCTAPWEHLTIYPNGDLKVCSWDGWCETLKFKKMNLFNYVKNDKIDWNKIYNSLYYRTIRKHINQNCYKGCMKNCPYIEENFKKAYRGILQANH